jgi:chloramphenicol 3-O-phosphotransferase
LNPKPRDYTDAAWQKSTTDAQLRVVVVQGGPAAGKSALMPANPALADEPEVLDAIITIVRGFGPRS